MQYNYLGFRRTLKTFTLNVNLLLPGSITNQVVKTKGGHTCVLPTKVDKATGYWFVSNPQPGDVFEYCTLDHTGLFRNWPWCSYGNKFPDVENGVETFKWDYCTGSLKFFVFLNLITNFLNSNYCFIKFVFISYL